MAVSGGGDSMALLAMLAASPLQAARRQSLVAITIDHGLRAGSADEAQAVGRWCAAQGIDHVISRWEKPVTGTGLQEAARLARYRLLADAAREAGALCVLTGHTLDDQRETVAMRRLRGEGRGSAGIAPATRFMEGEGMWFVRPLLTASRQYLRDWLTRQGIGWADDPSNLNPDFERVRVRQELADAGEGDLTALDRACAEAARDRSAMAVAVAAWIAAHASRAGDGTITLDAAAFQEGPVVVEGLRVLLAHCGVRDQLVDAGRALDAVTRLATGERCRFTLSGSLVERRGDALMIAREAPRSGQLSRTKPRDGGAAQARLFPWPILLTSHDLVMAQAMARMAGLPVPEAPSAWPNALERPQSGTSLNHM